MSLVRALFAHFPVSTLSVGWQIKFLEGRIMGCLDIIFGDPAKKKELKGRSEEQQKAILYFLNGTGGCLGKKACSDAEYDALVNAKLATTATKEQALEKLGVDVDQVKEIEPVRLEGWNYEKQRTKRGGDNILRSSGYQVTWLFFSANQVYAYQYQFAMDDDAKNVTTQEYFYKDITSFSTKSKTVEYNVFTGGGCFGAKKETKTDNVDVFSLSVAGDSFTAAMTPTDDTTKSIRAMQQKLREKKS
jgi:hypothetical protein